MHLLSTVLIKVTPPLLHRICLGFQSTTATLTKHNLDEKHTTTTAKSVTYDAIVDLISTSRKNKHHMWMANVFIY